MIVRTLLDFKQYSSEFTDVVARAYDFLSRSKALLRQRLSAIGARVPEYLLPLGY